MALDIEAERMVVRQTAEEMSSEVWAPPEVAEHVEVGDTATLHLDADGRTVGWYLPDKKIGVREDYR